jgi:hypothetical protein
MKTIHTIVIMAMMTLYAGAQTVPSQNNGAAPSNNAAVQAPASQNAALSILKPAAGEKLRQNSVTVTYALANPGASAAGSPNFQVRLDSQDPVTTTATEYSFTGLTPGSHTVTVQLVDANGTPVQGAQAVVQFTVLKQTARKHGPQAIAAALRLEPGTDIRIQQSTPAPAAPASGALPLLSVIGFGVLVGGLASAMKTRN